MIYFTVRDRVLNPPRLLQIISKFQYFFSQCASLDIPINEYIDNGDYYEVCSGDVSPVYLREIVTKTRSSPDWSKMDGKLQYLKKI